MRIKLIGVAGRAGVGKDTAGNMLANMIDGVTYAFAKPMKEAMKQVFGWNDEHVNGSLKEVIDPHYGVSPRKAMQTFGTEWGRNTINEDLWLLRADMELQDAIVNGYPLIITDVRFPNEAQWIRDNGGTVIHLRRDDAAATVAHASEQGLTPIEGDYSYDNSGSIRDLNVAMAKVIEDLFVSEAA